MAHGSKVCFLGLLVLAGSASATTVGPIKGRPVAGHPLEVNIPFAVDEPRDRACAIANVRYGNVLVPRLTLHVQGQGLKRNLLLTSRANVGDAPVTVNVRVGCGPKAVARRFVITTADLPVARSPAIARTASRQAPAADFAAARPEPRSVAMASPAEPLFPPPEAAVPEHSAPKADTGLAEDLRKARAEAATALAQLEGVRKELAAILDVERRTSQTLINAEHQVMDAKSEVARMRLVLKWVGAVLALAAAGAIWFEFSRVAARVRLARAQPEQEPTIFTGNEVPT